MWWLILLVITLNSFFTSNFKVGSEIWFMTKGNNFLPKTSTFIAKKVPSSKKSTYFCKKCPLSQKGWFFAKKVICLRKVHISQWLATHPTYNVTITALYVVVNLISLYITLIWILYFDKYPPGYLLYLLVQTLWCIVLCPSNLWWHIFIFFLWKWCNWNNY